MKFVQRLVDALTKLDAFHVYTTNDDDLDLWTYDYDEAVAQYARWKASGHAVRLAVRPNGDGEEELLDYAG